MNVSSRTPEGEPLQCEICGTVNAVEVSSAGDALCRVRQSALGVSEPLGTVAERAR